MSHRSRGFALLSAVWLLVALSALTLELSVVARQRRLAVANTLESVRAEAAAASGVEQQRARLARLLVREDAGSSWNDPLSVVDPWRNADASPRDSVVVDNDAYCVTAVADLGTLVNINIVDEPGLTRFLIASSVDPLAADAVSQSIMDWRDADDFRRLRGAERDEYIKADARELPRNGPFESVDELRFVRGVTRAMLETLTPRLTVFGTGEVNVNKAPEPVLLSVPGMTPLAAAIITGAQRDRRRIASLRQLMDMLPSPARAAFEQQAASVARLTFDTHELQVRSVGWVKGSPIRVRQTTLVTRVGSTPVVMWRSRE